MIFFTEQIFKCLKSLVSYEATLTDEGIKRFLVDWETVAKH